MGSADSTLRTTRRRRPPVRRDAFALRRHDLERWLCDPVEPVPIVHDLAGVFGDAFDLRVDPGDRAALTRRLRLIVAVLRDTFSTDDAARRWMHAAQPELGALRPLDLLARGRLAELEALVIGEWNRLASHRLSSSA